VRLIETVYGMVFFVERARFAGLFIDFNNPTSVISLNAGHTIEA
jgi:hypothetical protein